MSASRVAPCATRVDLLLHQSGSAKKSSLTSSKDRRSRRDLSFLYEDIADWCTQRLCAGDHDGRDAGLGSARVNVQCRRAQLSEVAKLTEFSLI
jgi:hypothetical protein